MKKTVVLIFSLVFLGYTIADVSATPGVYFQNPTYPSGTIINVNSFPINITSVDSLDTYVFVQLNATLLGWWRLEGNYNDESGNGNDGTCTNCPTSISTGRFGAAYNFTTPISNITIVPTASLNRAKNDFAISIWVDPNAGYGFEDDDHIDIVSRWGPGGLNNAAYVLGLNSSGFVKLFVYNGTASSRLSSLSTIPTGSWTHIVGTRDGTTLKIYINGMLDNSLTNAVATQSSTFNLVLGQEANEAGSPRNNFNGSIDEFLLFSKALYPEEVQALYNASLYQFYHNYANWPDGMHNYTAYAVNTNAQVNVTENRNITIDTVVPQVKFENPTTASGNYSSIGQTWIQANVSASDGGTGLNAIFIRLYNSGGSLLSTKISSTSPYFYNFTGLSGGMYFINATATDLAGNINWTETRNITTYEAPPQVPEFGGWALMIALVIVVCGFFFVRRERV